MPVLNVHEKQKQVFLPSTEELPEDQRAWVTMDISPLKTGDLAHSQDGASTAALIMDAVFGRIREWNFTDEEGTPLPITRHNFNAIGITDYNHMRDQIETGERLTDDERLKSSSTSEQSGTTVPIEVISPPST